MIIHRIILSICEMLVITNQELSSMWASRHNLVSFVEGTQLRFEDKYVPFLSAQVAGLGRW